MTDGDSNSTFLKAVATIILAIFLFDVQGALIKQMGTRYPVEQITFYRNIFGVIPHILILLFTIRLHDKRQSLFISQWRLALGRSALLIMAQICFYTSLTHMALATATTLAFSGPLFVTTLSIPLLGHRVGWVRAAAVAMGFLGVVMVMKPGRDMFSLFALLPVAAAFFYSLASLSSRFFDSKVSTAIISIYASGGAAVLALILMLVKGIPLAPAVRSDWLWFVTMGMVGGTAVFLLISAYRMTKPSSLSPFEYFGIPFSFILGWWFFSEAPFDSLFPGVLLIVGGGLLVFFRERG